MPCGKLDCINVLNLTEKEFKLFFYKIEQQGCRLVARDRLTNHDVA